MGAAAETNESAKSLHPKGTSSASLSSKPSTDMCLMISFLVKYFVNRSAGFSLPLILTTEAAPDRRTCCIQISAPSRCRMRFPGPRREQCPSGSQHTKKGSKYLYKKDTI